MATMKDMLEAHTELKDQHAVWAALMNWLGQYDSRAGQNKTLEYDGRVVPEPVMTMIRDGIYEDKVEPLQKKIDQLEGSTVEVKDGKRTKPVVGKKRSAPVRKRAGSGKARGAPSQ